MQEFCAYNIFCCKARIGRRIFFFPQVLFIKNDVTSLNHINTRLVKCVKHKEKHNFKAINKYLLKFLMYTLAYINQKHTL